MTEKRFHFKPIPYDQLKSKQKELFNFQKVASTLADYGFNCIKLADDWEGADFLAYHFEGKTTLRVQLKSRLTISKKYEGKDIWMAFPHNGSWYLIEHDRLVEKAGKHTDWLESSSWREKGGYSSRSINPEFLDSLLEDRLKPVFGALPPGQGDAESGAGT
jgi:frataxin-like iron-binding protein CyaY